MFRLSYFLYSYDTKQDRSKGNLFASTPLIYPTVREFRLLASRRGIIQRHSTAPSDLQ